MSIKITVTDEQKNETMYCNFNDELITFDLNGEILEVKEPRIIRDMTNEVIMSIYKCIKAYELTKLVSTGTISRVTLTEILNKISPEDNDEIPDDTIIIQSNITQ